jgi:DNA helicase-2/ATP-dependent DNA helicase PcrA
VSALRHAIGELQDNEQQWRAFNSPSPCTVLAPPGSGKTKLLTTRLAHDLIARIPEPHGAACITMTNAAADELSDRLAELGVKRRSNLFVGTVHSFALRCIVRPYARLGGLREVAASSLAEEAEQRTARAQAVEEIFGPTQDPHAQDLVNTLEQRRNLLDYDEATTELGGSRFARLARRYEQLLLEASRYDFKDLVRYAVELVECREWIQRVLAARFPHIYVDEYQDLPPGLDRLVRSLCFDQRANAELFAVGDPDQAIFGFSGTAPHLLRELAERPDVHDIALEFNYRSPQLLIDIAVRHLGEDRRVRGRPTGGTIEAIECASGFDHQIRTAQELIKFWRGRGVAVDEIAVLTRFNRQLDEVVTAFEQVGLPVFVRRERGYRQTSATSIVEAMAAWSVQVRDGRGVRLADIIRRLRSIARVDELLLVECIAAMLRQRPKPDAPAREFVEELVDAGFNASLERTRGADDVQQFARMRSALGERGSLAHTTVAELGLRARALDRLLLSTIHSAKGLEFDVVIVVGVDQGTIPFFAARTPKEAAEERRMFYVAITRARDAVYCLWTGWRDTRYGRRHDGPSEYLRALELV